MRILNKTKNKMLVRESKLCKSLLSKIIGLMFSKKIEDLGLIFVCGKEQKISLHMFFVFYPIDVLFLDKNRKVIDMKRNFRPFSFYSSRKYSKYVLELPNNTIDSSKTELGDIIDLGSINMQNLRKT